MRNLSWVQAAGSPYLLQEREIGREYSIGCQSMRAGLRLNKCMPESLGLP